MKKQVQVESSKTAGNETNIPEHGQDDDCL